MRDRREVGPRIGCVGSGAGRRTGRSGQEVGPSEAPSGNIEPNEDTRESDLDEVVDGNVEPDNEAVMDARDLEETPRHQSFEIYVDRSRSSSVTGEDDQDSDLATLAEVRFTADVEAFARASMANEEGANVENEIAMRDRGDNLDDAGIDLERADELGD